MNAPLDHARSSASDDPLVGRERELGRLRRVITGRQRTGPWLLEITGAPGIGKTRLLAEWSGLAERAGLTVLSGRVSPTDRHRHFAAFRKPVVRALGFPRVSAALNPGDRTLLLRHFEAAETRCTKEEQARLLRCIADLLWAATDEHRRLALCLDDLQWADDASVEMLRNLLRHPHPHRPLILVCSLRPRQRPVALTASLADPDDAYRVERIRLGPVPRGTVGELHGAEPALGRQQFLYEAAGGNPFYLRVLSQSPEPLVPPGGIDPWVLSDGGHDRGIRSGG